MSAFIHWTAAMDARTPDGLVVFSLTRRADLSPSVYARTRPNGRLVAVPVSPDGLVEVIS